MKAIEEGEAQLAAEQIFSLSLVLVEFEDTIMQIEGKLAVDLPAIVLVSFLPRARRQIAEFRSYCAQKLRLDAARSLLAVIKDTAWH